MRHFSDAIDAWCFKDIKKTKWTEDRNEQEVRTQSPKTK